MKIFCIGLGKTGTTTFRECCKILDISHKKGPVLRGLKAIKNGNVDLIRRYADRYDSFDDFPWAYLYRDLDKWYPGSLFVMTKRISVDVWYDSLCRHYDRTGKTEAKKLAYGYYNPYDDPDHHINLYLKHLSSARDYFKDTDRYIELCWQQDGWEELCGFLGKDAPDVEFPHKNKG